MRALAGVVVFLVAGCAVIPQAPTNVKAQTANAFKGDPCKILETAGSCDPKAPTIRTPFLNTSVAPGTNEILAQDYDLQPWLRAHPKLPKTAIIVTISGGGLRAAALGQAVLLALNQYSDQDDTDLAGKTGGTLADHVIAVSAVSGGAMVSAAFALGGIQAIDDLSLHRDPPTKDTFFDGTVLKQNLLLRAGLELLPTNWEDRTTPYLSLYRKLVNNAAKPEGPSGGREVTYRDLALRPNAPLLLLNSTDIDSGRIFTFGQLSFGDLCSDIMPYPLATAVDAAGNFPLVETAITLRNYRTEGNCPDGENDNQTITSFDQRGLNEAQKLERDAYQPYRNLFGSGDARYWLDMRYAGRAAADIKNISPDLTAPAKERQIEWMHLFDGGLADNLGLRTIANRLSNIENLERLRAREVRKIVLIVVNARSDEDNDEYRTSTTPRFLSIGSDNLIVEQSYGPIDRVTALTESNAFPTLDKTFYEGCASETSTIEKKSDGQLGPCGSGRVIPTLLYPVIIDFDQLTGPTYVIDHTSGAPTQKFSTAYMDGLRSKVKNISTQSSLTGGKPLGALPKQLDDIVALRTVGRLLLARNPCFQAYFMDTKKPLPDGTRPTGLKYQPGPLDDQSVSANVEDYPHVEWDAKGKTIQVPGTAPNPAETLFQLYTRCYPLEAEKIHGARFSDYVTVPNQATVRN